MKGLTALFVLLALTAAPTSVAAQDDVNENLEEFCKAFTIPDPGEWAAYTADSPEGKAEIRLTSFSNNDPSTGGSNARVMEMAVTAGGQSMVMQMTTPGYPFSSNDVSRMVMKASGQPAYVMPPQFMQSMGGNPMEGPIDCVASCMASKYVGKETLQTPAGDFETVHVVPEGQEQADVWLSPDVPFGIVKAEGGGGQLKLAAYGEDAEPMIRPEEIQEMPGMSGFPGMINQ